MPAAAAVTQFYRVLKPGGVVYITLWGTLQQVPYVNLTSSVLCMQAKLYTAVMTVVG
jgi:ubiquinone/menaquinone biosynthesis C-methylase UbiE